MPAPYGIFINTSSTQQLSEPREGIVTAHFAPFARRLGFFRFGQRIT
jgi:hypothetical protein